MSGVSTPCPNVATHLDDGAYILPTSDAAQTAGGREMSDQLNTLTDAELSRAFAVEVAGWGIHAYALPRNPARSVAAMIADHVLCLVGDEEFATSMDAVLPYLEKQRFLLSRQFAPAAYVVRVETRRVAYAEGCDKSFPRAACIALVLAVRAEKEAAK